jgi:hypothetical protein
MSRRTLLAGHGLHANFPRYLELRRLLGYDARGPRRDARRYQRDALAHCEPIDPDLFPAEQLDAGERIDLQRGLDALAHAGLSERVLRVLAWRLEGRTLDEIGAEIGLSRERIRQIEHVGPKVARQELRAALARRSAQIVEERTRRALLDMTTAQVERDRWATRRARRWLTEATTMEVR